MAVDMRRAVFVRSAAGEGDFPRDLPQVAVAGRSNVGKSSLINCLTRRRSLARVGSSPGRTAFVNCFLIDGSFYLADLPGYGYARVSKAERQRWAGLMECYFARRDRIALGLLVVDARHAPTEDDRTMERWFARSRCPLVVAANKCDRLKSGEVSASLARIRETLDLGQEVPVIPVSARTGQGREELTGRLLAGLGLAGP